MLLELQDLPQKIGGSFEDVFHWLSVRDSS
jgi:hypothetical protein